MLNICCEALLGLANAAVTEHTDAERHIRNTFAGIAANEAQGAMPNALPPCVLLRTWSPRVPRM